MRIATGFVLIFLVAQCCISACTQAQNVIKVSNNSGHAVDTQRTRESENGNQEPRTRKEDVLGCWSSGSGKILRITDGDVRLSTHGFTPVPYESVTPSQSAVRTIRLIDRPQFYFFKEYLALSVKKDASGETILMIRDNASLEGLYESTAGDESSWVPDDCSKWFSSKD